jgi:putative DNA primase/helicase
MLSAGRERSVLSLARGIVERQVTDLDRDLDLLNTPSGVVDLTTGELLPHDPALFITKIAGAEYRPGFTHPDWDKALEAVPADIQDWYQLRLGQAITGHMTPDDLLVVSQGSGENGKSTVNETTARAAGDYFLMASDRILLANPDQHPTELMDLQGVRYAVAEETPEARRLAVTRLKKTIGTPRITARRVHKDDVTFDATHSFFLSTNYKPIVEETDHGTWRRLALVRLPYTFRKPHEKLTADTDGRGDPTLRARCCANPEVWAAALAWMVEGARRWYAADKIMPEPPQQVAADTREWRVESDQVLAYADERLVFDPGWHVMALDLLDEVNAWLTSRGHRPWSDKTLAARFGEHDEIIRKGVRKGRIRKSDELSRPPAILAETEPGFEPVGIREVPAGLYTAWLGVRFATREDAEKDAAEDAPDKGKRESVQGVQGGYKPVSRGAMFEVSNLPAHPAQEPERPAPPDPCDISGNGTPPAASGGEHGDSLDDELCPSCDKPFDSPNPALLCCPISRRRADAMTCACGQPLLAPQSRQRGICEHCWFATGNPSSVPVFTGDPECWRSHLPLSPSSTVGVIVGVIHIDWSDADHWNRGRRQPCRICSKPSFLLDDAKRPCHKKCVEDAVANRRHLQVVQP